MSAPPLSTTAWRIGPGSGILLGILRVISTFCLLLVLGMRTCLYGALGIAFGRWGPAKGVGCVRGGCVKGWACGNGFGSCGAFRIDRSRSNGTGLVVKDCGGWASVRNCAGGYCRRQWFPTGARDAKAVFMFSVHEMKLSRVLVGCLVLGYVSLYHLHADHVSRSFIHAIHVSLLASCS